MANKPAPISPEQPRLPAVQHDGGGVVGSVVDRAARLQAGLAGRGYDGTLRVLVPDARVSVRFVSVSVTLLAVLTVLTFALERPLS